jgi:hypothetical protein
MIEMAKNKTIFELGKYYEHTAGDKLHVCGVCATHTYGKCLVAEDDRGKLIPVGEDEHAAENYREITKEEFLGDSEMTEDEKFYYNKGYADGKKELVHGLCASFEEEFYNYETKHDYYSGFDDGLKRAMRLMKAEVRE